MFSKKSTPIGLDIGSAYIKVAKVNDTKKGYELAFFDILPIQPGIIKDEIISDKDSLANSIKELLKEVGIKRCKTVIGLSGRFSVITKRITLPLMTEQELNLSIKYEAEQYVPFDIDDIDVAFQILGPIAEQKGQMDVILVAAKKKLIEDYSEVVEKAGLMPAIVDTDSFAISNLHEVNYGANAKDNIAVINIGARITNIVILQNGMPAFTRDYNIGSNYHTEELKRSLNISEEDAERLKMKSSSAGISPDDAQRIINSASDELCGEIYKEFEYFKSAREIDIERVVLSGGTALIEGFSNTMAERLGMQVEVIDPFRNIKIPDKLDADYIKEIAPIAAVAIGLALRRVGDG
ncbi:pilus assembly protein PilM [Thermodesulfovibrionales bacterium]|nr:pilus assembly protein PilM [Thermodesulfovibrionales bacterium]